MKLLVTGRQAGKTTKAVEWVLDGERCAGYPGWTRVLIVPTMDMLDFMRTHYWGAVEDFSRRIYALQEWQNAHGVRDVDVCLDNLEWFIHSGMPRLPGTIVAATITAEPWES